MLKKTLVGAALALTSCLAVADSKPAPQIENIKDIRVDGKKYTPKQYVDAFCQKSDADRDDNCRWAGREAIRAMSKPVKVEW